jgi:hypothetical protein
MKSYSFHDPLSGGVAAKSKTRCGEQTGWVFLNSRNEIRCASAVRMKITNSEFYVLSAAGQDIQLFFAVLCEPALAFNS